MKPRIILVVSVVYLALGMLNVLAFVFLPSLLDARGYWGRFAFAFLVILLIWLSVRIIQGKSLARFTGAVVFAPLALAGVLAIPIYVMQSFYHVVPQDALSPLQCLFDVAFLLAFGTIFGVKDVFRKPQMGDITKTTTGSAGAPENKTRR